MDRWTQSVVGLRSGPEPSMEESMYPVLAKTFGGLSAPYYLRHFIFGLAFPIFVFMMLSQSSRPIHMPLVLMMVLNTMLYPYSRFVYESIVNFIVGENVFFVGAVLALVVKAMTMAFCWVGAIFVAPLGLAYLYFHHSRS